MKALGKTLALLLPVALLGQLGNTASAAGQSVLIDRGTFRLTRDGQEVGFDSFSVLRTGTGETSKILVDGDVLLDGRRIKSIVETSGQYGFLAYQANISGQETAKVTVEPRGRRLEVRVQSASGEQARELRAREGAVVMEEGVSHHYYFLGALYAAGSVREGAVLPVILARGDDQALLELLTAESTSLTVGGRSIEGWQLSLTMGGVARKLWIDRSGKVLRVEIPTTGLVAERLRPPSP
jgi:hypothetical protein